MLQTQPWEECPSQLRECDQTDILNIFSSYLISDICTLNKWLVYTHGKVREGLRATGMKEGWSWVWGGAA